MLNLIELQGFKSIRDLKLRLGSLNILVGANGAGKSNLLSFFKLLNYLTSGSLQRFIGEAGGGGTLLYYGSKVTPQFNATLHFSTLAGVNRYYFRLVSAANDTLIFADEAVAFRRLTETEKESAGRHDIKLKTLGAGHKETLLKDIAENLDVSDNINKKTVQTIKKIMDRWRVYHFHDTSAEANIKKTAYLYDNYYLRADAGNLAAFLFAMKESKPEYYHRIIATIRLVLPFFDDFVLAPSMFSMNHILLNWRERGSLDSVFGPHQLSDGSLRMMALVTVLLQPELPELIILDEPELGLHPYAINVLASLLKNAAAKTQVIVSTQSVGLVDQFEPENVIVVEREKRPEGEQSIFRRLETAALQEWLAEYSLGELWEKNVIGGRPS